jgi:DNA modification methylase
MTPSPDLPSQPLLNTIPLSSIKTLPARQRRVFDETAALELRESIEADGLIHCPSLREDPDTGDLILVAGERRLRAIKEIFALGGSFIFNETLFQASEGLVPYTSLGVCTEFEAESAELSENLRRKDLTWQEHADAVARLHRYKVKVAELVQSVEPSAPAHTVAKTAEVLYGRGDGSYQDRTRKEIILADHLNNPVIAKAKSADEAFKLLKADAVRQQNIASAIRVGASFTSQSHTILNVDCLTWMQAYAGPGFDIILTDPPYGMGADSFGDAAGKLTGTTHVYDDSLESWTILMREWCKLSYSVTAAQAHAYVFCDFDNFHALKSMMQAAGWYVFRTPFIVHKLGSGRVPLPDRGPRRCYETILYAIKGNKPVTHIYPDVIPVKGDDNLGHGAQKPVELMQNLLQRSVTPGARILDAFAGTGPVLEAAHGMKCYSTLLEKDPGSYGIILQRAAKLDALSSGELFPSA